MYSDILYSLRQQIESLNKKIDTGRSIPGYVSISTVIKPRLSIYPVIDDHCFFWSRPAQHQTMIGFNSLFQFTARGSHRFRSLKNNYKGVLKQWSGDTQPTAFIAFAFNADDPMQGCWNQLPNTLLSIPEIIIEDNLDAQRITINLNVPQTDIELLVRKIDNILSRFTPASPDKLSRITAAINIKSLTRTSTVDKDAWLALTQDAINAIRAGKFEKLVTTRQLSVSIRQPFDIQRLLAQLLKYYPTCSIFNYQSQGQTILAASPERLLSLHNQHIRSDAIGGTISRTPDSLSGFNASENKLLNEHAIIANDIYHRLDPYCHVLKMPVNPLLMKLHNMYHLETPISGQLREQENIFDVIETLHPTPAIAGYPARQAQQWLIQNECYNRGWYTGAFGWIRGTDKGELSVFLRCALIENHSAQLFAGAGLVAESVAEQEWQETELKINTILNML